MYILIKFMTRQDMIFIDEMTNLKYMEDKIKKKLF